MKKEKASKYLADKARKEVKDIFHVWGADGDFEITMRGSVITAKQFNPKWNGSNDLEGVPVYSGKEVQFKIEAI